MHNTCCVYLPHPDIDECLSPTKHNCSAHNNTFCVNTEGSFQCNCVEGFSRATESDASFCQGMYECWYINDYIMYVDDDECWMGTHNCSYNEDCVNGVGNYSCLCKEGFERLQPDGSCDGKSE